MHNRANDSDSISTFATMKYPPTLPHNPSATNIMASTSSNTAMADNESTIASGNHQNRDSSDHMPLENLQEKSEYPGGNSLTIGDGVPLKYDHTSIVLVEKRVDLHLLHVYILITKIIEKGNQNTTHHSHKNIKSVNHTTTHHFTQNIKTIPHTAHKKESNIM